MKALIAGAGGYIGSEFTEFLLQKDIEVIALDRFFFGPTLQDLEKNRNLKIVKADTRYFDENILKGVDAVYDLSSISNDPAAELIPEITYDINCEGAFRLAQLAKKMGVKRYILSASCSVYGKGDGVLTENSMLHPVSVYAKSKIKAEEKISALKSDDFSVTFCRCSTVYGLSKRRMRFDLIINIMTLHAYQKGRLYITGGGKQWRPLIHIQDLIRAFHIIGTASELSTINGEVFNIGTNAQNYQVDQVAYMFRDYFPNIEIIKVPDDPDKRSYQVNFDKFCNRFDFKALSTPKEGIQEIKRALEHGEIEDSLKTRTVAYYKFLIEADKALSEIKINNQLF